MSYGNQVLAYIHNIVEWCFERRNVTKYYKKEKSCMKRRLRKAFQPFQNTATKLHRLIW